MLLSDADYGTDKSHTALLQTAGFHISAHNKCAVSQFWFIRIADAVGDQLVNTVAAKEPDNSPGYYCKGKNIARAWNKTFMQLYFYIF